MVGAAAALITACRTPTPEIARSSSGAVKRQSTPSPAADHGVADSTQTSPDTRDSGSPAVVRSQVPTPTPTERELRSPAPTPSLPPRHVDAVAEALADLPRLDFAPAKGPDSAWSNKQRFAGFATRTRGIPRRVAELQTDFADEIAAGRLSERTTIQAVLRFTEGAIEWASDAKSRSLAEAKGIRNSALPELQRRLARLEELREQEAVDEIRNKYDSRIKTLRDDIEALAGWARLVDEHCAAFTRTMDYLERYRDFFQKELELVATDAPRMPESAGELPKVMSSALESFWTLTK